MPSIVSRVFMSLVFGQLLLAPALARCAMMPLLAQHQVWMRPALRMHVLSRHIPALPPLDAACVCYLRALGTPIYNIYMRQLTAPPAEQQQQQQQQGEQEAGSSGAAATGAAAVAAAPDAAADPGARWQLVYCPSDPVVDAGGLVAVSEGGRLLRHGLVQGPGGLEPAEGVDASDT